ncbi:MAG: sulfur carrier protein ThiS adenylyltransferase ThiF [Candidatus Omnitrophica bacterium]|nr:sulfur carrier protein ThiS adenylyltransferase ThiF [Candidatus Omnitrophota bacterium]MBU2250625.1 sulfur carrier protein ThiS adenylyltransferase ThiF [Candidatus Omnitrophota bacterium]
MNEFEKALLKYFSPEDLKKIQTAKVGIAGLGGLGSNCANSLVRCGVKNLVLVDFDKVEASNLNRQFYFLDQLGKNKVSALKETLLKINPGLNITGHCLRLEKDNILSVFEDCLAVVEAFDQAEYKSLIVQTLLPTGKFIVSASGLAGHGKSDEIKIRRIKNNLVLVGDLKSEASSNLPPLAPRVNIAAAKQADAVLEYILQL